MCESFTNNQKIADISWQVKYLNDTFHFVNTNLGKKKKKNQKKTMTTVYVRR